MKRKSEAKRNERSEVKETKQKNILKRNQGKTASIYFRYKEKQKYGSRLEQKEKYRSKQSEQKNTAVKNESKRKIQKRNKAQR
jgi:hypothetical protein